MPNPKPRKGRKPVGGAADHRKSEAAPAPSPAVSEPIRDWELAFLALYAEDAFCIARTTAGARLDRPAPDPRLSPRWAVLGTVTAVDAPLRFGRHKIGAREVFYGWLLKNRRTEQLVLAIRGTEGCVEWLIDGLFAPRTAHPVAGKVESGFWSVFSSMRLDGKPLIPAVTAAANGSLVTVVGHSLGAALATYASLELARAGVKVRGVFVASPHPGDRTFCKAFGEAVPDHILYRNAADLVPRVPFWFGYSDVPKVTVLSPSKSGVTITGGLAAQHHLLTYATLMDHAAFGAFKPLPVDRHFVDCVHL